MKGLLVRTASGIVFLVILLAALLWCQEIFALIFGFIISVMMYEYLRITMGKKHIFAQLMSMLLGLGVFALSFAIVCYHIDLKFALILSIPIILILISLLYDSDKESYKNYAFLLSAPLYIALPFSLCTLVIHNSAGEFSGNLLLSLLIMLWASDVGAYIFGISFGQKPNTKKLFPSISPKKSWVGYWGGLLSTIIAAIILSYFSFLELNLLNALIVGLIINIFGTLGDLAESQLKRNFNIKDSGKIMPGHGGLLDRFDGALLSFPIAITYIILIA